MPVELSVAGFVVENVERAAGLVQEVVVARVLMRPGSVGSHRWMGRDRVRQGCERREHDDGDDAGAKAHDFCSFLAAFALFLKSVTGLSLALSPNGPSMTGCNSPSITRSRPSGAETAHWPSGVSGGFSTKRTYRSPISYLGSPSM